MSTTALSVFAWARSGSNIYDSDPECLLQPSARRVSLAKARRSPALAALSRVTRRASRWLQAAVYIAGAMAHIVTAEPSQNRVRRLSDFLEIAKDWQGKQGSAEDDGFLTRLWYRGVNRQFPSLAPGVYRPNFTNRAERLKNKGGLEAKRLFLERQVLAQFRSAGAAFLNRDNLVEIYFAAQHFGMPTRLLDWSTNPLAALFFACDGGSEYDGVVYAMDAKLVIRKDAKRAPGEKLYQAIMTMRHPFVEYAIGLSFWKEPKEDHFPHVLPVRPDIIPGRIGQQSSCFTLHMHKAQPVDNASLITISVDAKSKASITRELRQLNINQFTIYNDLDHLSAEVKRTWGLTD
ncbi:MAG TPA: FRG domain-containing protein [Polyangiaceae bacterium]|nr:FRG domain-containing protein [Polyangiaceae bacterium]